MPLSNRLIFSNNSGNVGIGTTAPAYALDVANTARFLSNSSNSRVVYFKQHASNVGNIVQFVDSGDNNIWELVGRNNQFYIYNGSTGVYQLYINPSNSRIGINQTSPLGQLHITSSAITAAAPSLGWPVYNAEADTNSRPIYIDTGGNGGFGTAGQGATVAILLGQYFDSRVVITPTGNGGASPGDQGTGYGKDLMLKAGTSDNGVGYKGGRLYLSGGMGYTSGGYNGNVGDILMQPFTSAGGNVGIGVTAASSKLTVRSSSTNFNDNANAIRIEYPGSPNAGEIGGGIVFGQYWFSGSTEVVRTGGIYGVKTGGGGTFGGGLVFYSQPNDGNNMEERMRLTHQGYLGIGTTAPASKLHVAGQSLFTTTRTAPSSSTSSVINLGADEYINFAWSTSYNANSDYHRIGKDRTYNGYALSYCSGGEDAPTNIMHAFRVGGGSGTTSTAMVMLANAKVGIGNTSPRSKLTVTGPVSVGEGNKLSFIGLDINSSGTPSFIKITTSIPSGLGGDDFTVNIKGFRYGGADTTDLKICWHWYVGTFYNATISSSGSWAPTVRLSAEGGYIAIVLTSPEYWPKLYVESMYTSAYNDAYTTGWTWSDADASGSPIVTLTYKSNFGNSIVANSTGLGVGTGSPSVKLHVAGASIISNNTGIDPDSYTNTVVSGAIADGSGWGVSSAIGGNAGTGHSWAIGHNGNYLYFAVGNGSANNSFASYLVTGGSSRHLWLTPQSGGSVGIGIAEGTAPASKLEISGTATATAFNSTSDARLKENFESIPDPLTKVMAIRGLTYNFRDDLTHQRHVGILAQDLLDVLPEAVSGTEDTKYTVSYNDIVAVLVEAVKELKAEIDTLKNNNAKRID